MSELPPPSPPRPDPSQTWLIRCAIVSSIFHLLLSALLLTGITISIYYISQGLKGGVGAPPPALATLALVPAIFCGAPPTLFSLFAGVSQLRAAILVKRGSRSAAKFLQVTSIIYFTLFASLVPVEYFVYASHSVNIFALAAAITLLMATFNGLIAWTATLTLRFMPYFIGQPYRAMGFDVR